MAGWPQLGQGVICLSCTGLFSFAGGRSSSLTVMTDADLLTSKQNPSARKHEMLDTSYACGRGMDLAYGQ